MALIIPIVLIVLVLGFCGYCGVKNQTSTTKDTVAGLSKPASRIMERYLQLPEDKRPAINLRAVLMALDKRVTKENADVHFLDNTYSNMYPSWSWTFHSRKVTVGCGGSGSHWDDKKCDYQGYRSLWKEIDEMVEAHIAQEYAVHKSGIDVSDVSLITERVREETNIIKQVTKEIQ